MNRRSSPFIDIVRMEDKEAKLKAFIQTVVEQAAAKGDVASGEAILLIARSVESPVAKAVASLVREGVIANPIKPILAIVPRQEAEQAACDTFNTLVADHGGRVIRDARLFDAHEQIVLGQSASWVGDCMRRDPMKRDAYECFAADCTKTAGWARTSHERLWNHCEPMPEIVFAPLPPAEVVDAATVNAVAETDSVDPMSGQ